MGPLFRRAAAIRASGFTLIEVVVVMVILAILIAMASALTRGVTAAQKRSLTATRIATVDAALAQFVTQQKRLPCPANGTLPSADASAGVEMRDLVLNVCAPVNQQDGVVPWRALGLSEADATDGWDRRLTYRIDPNLAVVNGMNMSWCDPAGTEAPVEPATGRNCNTSCANTALNLCTPPYAFLAAKGLIVKNLATPQVTVMDPGVNPHTGAAYVVISAGESGGGAYLSSGTLGVSTVGDGTEEQRNWASKLHSSTYYYVDDTLAEVTTAAHFDDLVSRPSLLSVISKAGLGPRSH